eukprot:CAMPEP_0116131088 /NCGR_PEP_ID=MMETSP0329-20121206/8821_1 /TAXON_ID=697910 /ORGANISM="Pseudo-nitzschia arenysensis, Strain B593" /LENGTH=988 /DNA_ID=CAMNT_0003625499 /DNA_START=154 /DNA_END=3117 /DNA_ORIENTATION=-
MAGKRQYTATELDEMRAAKRQMEDQHTNLQAYENPNLNQRSETEVDDLKSSGLFTPLPNGTDEFPFMRTDGVARAFKRVYPNAIAKIDNNMLINTAMARSTVGRAPDAKPEDFKTKFHLVPNIDNRLDFLLQKRAKDNKLTFISRGTIPKRLREHRIPELWEALYKKTDGTRFSITQEEKITEDSMYKYNRVCYDFLNLYARHFDSPPNNAHPPIEPKKKITFDAGTDEKKEEIRDWVNKAFRFYTHIFKGAKFRDLVNNVAHKSHLSVLQQLRTFRKSEKKNEVVLPDEYEVDFQFQNGNSYTVVLQKIQRAHLKLWEDMAYADSPYLTRWRSVKIGGVLTELGVSQKPVYDLLAEFGASGFVCPGGEVRVEASDTTFGILFRGITYCRRQLQEEKFDIDIRLPDYDAQPPTDGSICLSLLEADQNDYTPDGVSTFSGTFPSKSVDEHARDIFASWFLDLNVEKSHEPAWDYALGVKNHDAFKRLWEKANDAGQGRSVNDLLQGLLQPPAAGANNPNNSSAKVDIKKVYDALSTTMQEVKRERPAQDILVLYCENFAKGKNWFEYSTAKKAAIQWIESQNNINKFAGMEHIIDEDLPKITPRAFYEYPDYRFGHIALLVSKESRHKLATESFLESIINESAEQFHSILGNNASMYLPVSSSLVKFLHDQQESLRQKNISVKVICASDQTTPDWLAQFSDVGLAGKIDWGEMGNECAMDKTKDYKYVRLVNGPTSGGCGFPQFAGNVAASPQGGAAASPQGGASSPSAASNSASPPSSKKCATPNVPRGPILLDKGPKFLAAKLLVSPSPAKAAKKKKPPKTPSATIGVIGAEAMTLISSRDFSDFQTMFQKNIVFEDQITGQKTLVYTGEGVRFPLAQVSQHIAWIEEDGADVRVGKVAGISGMSGDVQNYIVELISDKTEVTVKHNSFPLTTIDWLPGEKTTNREEVKKIGFRWGRFVYSHEDVIHGTYSEVAENNNYRPSESSLW